MSPLIRVKVVVLEYPLIMKGNTLKKGVDFQLAH